MGAPWKKRSSRKLKTFGTYVRVLGYVPPSFFLVVPCTEREWDNQRPPMVVGRNLRYLGGHPLFPWFSSSSVLPLGCLRIEEPESPLALSFFLLCLSLTFHPLEHDSNSNHLLLPSLITCFFFLFWKKRKKKEKFKLQQHPLIMRVALIKLRWLSASSIFQPECLFPPTRYIIYFLSSLSRLDPFSLLLSALVLKVNSCSPSSFLNGQVLRFSLSLSLFFQTSSSATNFRSLSILSFFFCCALFLTARWSRQVVACVSVWSDRCWRNRFLPKGFFFFFFFFFGFARFRNERKKTPTLSTVRAINAESTPCSHELQTNEKKNGGFLGHGVSSSNLSLFFSSSVLLSCIEMFFPLQFGKMEMPVARQGTAVYIEPSTIPWRRKMFLVWNK